MRQPLHLMDDGALAQYRAQLLRGRRALDAELTRVTHALEDRRRQHQRPLKHGASGYRRGCHCPVCMAGHADENARWRATRAAGARERKTR